MTAIPAANRLQGPTVKGPVGAGALETWSRFAMNRLPILVCLVLGVLGCNNAPSRTFNSEELNKLGGNRLQAIADDKALSDADCFKKYFDTHPGKPNIVLPPSIAPWAEAKPLPGGDGYHVVIHDVENPFMKAESAEAAMSAERLKIKAYAEFCRSVLEHLQARKVKSVAVSLYKALKNEKEYQEVFRVQATPADLPKLAKATDAPEAGSVFDPRGPRIGELWKVELNLYPEIKYQKK